MKKPFIVIEGQDRTGKSTLVNQLANFYGPGAVKSHSSSPPKDLSYPDNKIWEDNNYFKLFNLYDTITETNAVITDRFHLGMYVFGKRFRKYPERYHVTDIERLVTISNNTFLILLTDDPKELMKRDDGMSYEKSESDFAETAFEFQIEYARSLIPHKLHINITVNGGFNNTYETVLKFIESKRYANSV